MEPLVKRELRTLSPDELDSLIYKYIKWLNFGKRKRPRHLYRTVEEKIAKVLELVKNITGAI